MILVSSANFTGCEKAFILGGR